MWKIVGHSFRSVEDWYRSMTTERLELSNVVAIIYARDEGVTDALSSIFDDHIPQMHTI